MQRSPSLEATSLREGGLVRSLGTISQRVCAQALVFLLEVVGMLRSAGDRAPRRLGARVALHN